MTPITSIFSPVLAFDAVHRRVCAGLMAWLAAMLVILGMGVARAADEPQPSPEDNIAANPTLAESPASGFASRRIDGQPFFLLSDRSYGSGQVAQVRLEAGGQDDETALAGYGGADIVVYRVPRPMDFLKAQKNLHRLSIAPNYKGEGLANTVAYLWDRWFSDARRAWQRMLSYSVRRSATEAQPQFRLGDQVGSPTQFEPTTQFSPLKGYDVVARFRYPIWDAKPIEPPAGVKLEGSSSQFFKPEDGNVMIPVGKLSPGLYIVEAMIGSYRAHTLLFVSDTVGIVKAASTGLLLWTARRSDGTPAPETSVVWTDGVGVLKSGKTGADGTLALEHADPERSYVLGVDDKGGVFVSENFYYDSEIYNTKIYAFTDRPMYRPGETVHMKFIGRTFTSATQSNNPASADLDYQLIDPNGSPIAAGKTHFESASGAQADITLPGDATAGGYTLRFRYGQDDYGAAFRVAQYVKPRFDVNLLMDKADYATGEPLHGQVQLRYPDGSPVRNASVSVTLRAQRVSVVDGELRYSGLFPVKLDQQELRTGADGNVALTLPAAQDPSRYALTLFAQDGAAYRMRVTREVLIARGATPYGLSAVKLFSQPGETVDFTLKRGAAGSVSTHPPTTWEWVRLESQTRSQGTLGTTVSADSLSVPLKFEQPGSYMVSVKDSQGNLLAATSHWVAGEGLQALPGSVEVVFDRRSYQVGDTAEALITFPGPVADALLTLERDRVEKHALLSSGADWLSLQRVAPTQWKARIKVGAGFAPNMTFSVLYVRDGAYAFQNAGIVVAQPTLALTVHSDKAVYAPGDTVTLDLTSSLAGKPVPANLTVSVVDEMVYVLQPEIAPNIVDFFYHPRRNNVRTSSSLSFITYDLAISGMRGAPHGPSAGNYNERGVKVLERPRRDEQDTAAWRTNLHTDAAGHVSMTFKMPDSLARWRVTVRAIADDGNVGQRTSYVQSDKALYLKWSGPVRFRMGDRPVLDMLAFNHTGSDAQAQWIVSGAGLNVSQAVTLKPGANYLRLPAAGLQSGTIYTQLVLSGRVADRLQTTVHMDAPGWLSPRQSTIALDGGAHPLSLAPDARDIRLRLVGDASSQFLRIADDLIDYPYDSAEQTASRLIPLALAHDALLRGDDLAVAGQLETRLRSERQRLTMLAGIGGTFGWWGDTTGGDVLLTAYAYYADWLASHSLGIDLPDGNWRHALDLYRDRSASVPLLHRALALWFLQQMGMPVATPVAGVATALMHAKPTVDLVLQDDDSLVFAAPDSERGIQMATVLIASLARDSSAGLPDGFAGQAEAARAALAADQTPWVQSLLYMTGMDQADQPSNIAALLSRAGAAYPTLDRSLTLLWLRKALVTVQAATPPQADPVPQGGGWTARTTPTGATAWDWTGATPPATLDFGAARPGMDAVVSYRSAQTESSELPLMIQRTWYRLESITPDPKAKIQPVQGQENFRAVALQPGDALDTNSLYVDEISLSPHGGVFQYGVVQAPLPPGGSVEATSWGVDISGLPDSVGDQPQPFARAVRYEMGAMDYLQPVPFLHRPIVLRQLVRFALPGTFVMPPVRYFRMYQPSAKAFEGGSSDKFTTLQVR